MSVLKGIVRKKKKKQTKTTDKKITDKSAEKNDENICVCMDIMGMCKVTVNWLRYSVHP